MPLPMIATPIDIFESCEVYVESKIEGYSGFYALEGSCR